MIQIPGTEIQLRLFAESIEVYDQKSNTIIELDAKSAMLLGDELRISSKKIHGDKILNREQLELLVEQRKRQLLEESRRLVADDIFEAIYEQRETVRISGFTPKEIIDELRKDYVIEKEAEHTNVLGPDCDYVIRLEPN